MSTGTYMPSAKEISRKWYVVDGTGKPLGRLASEVAKILRGKNKPTYTPHADMGDHVIIINSSQVILTGKKLDTKIYYRHTMYPGGLRAVPYRTFMAKTPERAVEKAVKGMLPHNTLGDRMFMKLKVYAGPDHPHAAQMPESLEINV